MTNAGVMEVRQVRQIEPYHRGFEGIKVKNTDKSPFERRLLR